MNDPDQTHQQLDVQQCLRIIKNRKWVVLGVFSFVFLAAAAYIMRTPVKYKADATVYTDRSSSSLLPAAPEAVAYINSGDLLRSVEQTRTGLIPAGTVVIAEPGAGSRVVRLTAESATEKGAVTAASEVARAFVAKSASPGVNIVPLMRHAVDALEEQRAATLSRLSAAKKTLRASSQRLGTASQLNSTSDLYRALVLDGRARDVYSIEQELNAIDREIVAARKELAVTQEDQFKKTRESASIGSLPMTGMPTTGRATLVFRIAIAAVAGLASGLLAAFAWEYIASGNWHAVRVV